MLKAVILDWAGTTVDHGSLAPVRTLQRVFHERGIAVSEQDARRDMGLPKKDHIRNLLGHLGLDTSEPHVADLYASFIPRQLEVLDQYATLIPGVLEAVAGMRERGLKIGSTTGYTRPMLELLEHNARQQGYVPDCALVPDDVGQGRPHPYMIYEAARLMQTYPLWAYVKIGDTPVDMEEGRNAGTWTIGLSRTGNMIGLSLEELNHLHHGELQHRLVIADAQLTAAGAHFVVGGIEAVGPVLDEIEGLLALGRRP